MRHTRKHSGFFLCFIINLLLNIEWILPSLIFTALSIWLKYPVFIWLAVISFVLYVGVVCAWTGVLSYISRTSAPTPLPENKNPYSNKISNPYEKD